jgi:protein LTV1
MSGKKSKDKGIKYYVMPRSVEDPLIDESPSMMIPAQVAEKKQQRPKKVKAPNFNAEAERMLYGFYDYSSHLKPMGHSGGVFIPAVGLVDADLSNLRSEEKAAKNQVEVTEGDILKMRDLYKTGQIKGEKVDAREVGDEYFDALEDIGEFEELEDDFVLKALGSEGETDYYEDEKDYDGRYVEFFEEDENEFDGFESGDSERSESEYNDEDDEEAFDQIAAEYTDEEIGELQRDESDPELEGDIDDIEGYYAEVFEEYERKRSLISEESIRGGQADPNIAEGVEIIDLTKKALERLTLEKDEELSEEKLLEMFAPKQQRDEFDCESIISSRVSTSSRYIPKLIKISASNLKSTITTRSLDKSVELNRKDVPKESEVSQSEISPVQIRLSSGNPLSASQLLFKKKPNKMDFSLASVPEDKEIADEDESSSTSSDEQRSANELIESVQARNRKETALEKKARKAAVKEERKLNRQRKKLTKESFKKQQHNQHILNVQNGIANPNRVRI